MEDIEVVYTINYTVGMPRKGQVFAKHAWIDNGQPERQYTRTVCGREVRVSRSVPGFDAERVGACKRCAKTLGAK